MNKEPEKAIRVPHEPLRQFVEAAARKVEIPDEQARLLSELLIASDLRGVFSHGSQLIVRYANEIKRGGINPRPTVTVARQTPQSLVVDGGCGLGYFPACEGTRRVIEMARQHGMAAMVTRNHGHIGAAGTYARMTLRHDLITFVTSGVQLDLHPGDLVTQAAGASPMAFSAPTQDEPPIVLDCGVTIDVNTHSPHREEIARLAPGLVLRSIGFGTICQAWGGMLTGLPVDAERATDKYPDANQGAMLFTMQVGLFADAQRYKREMDAYVRRTQQLKPLEHTSGPYLPGGMEAEQEARNRAEGIPVGESHQEALEKLADELKVPLPWK